jgi:hypothetical protein
LSGLTNRRAERTANAPPKDIFAPQQHLALGQFASKTGESYHLITPVEEK